METAEKRCAYIHAQAACALIEAIGMFCANNQCPDCQPYSKKDFDALLINYPISHNAVIGYLREV